MLASQTSLPTWGRSRKEGEGGGTFAVNSTQDMPACAMEIPWVPTRNIYLWRKAIKKVFFQFYGSNTQVEILAELNFFHMVITLPNLILYSHQTSGHCTKMQGWSIYQWYIHCSSVSATVRASLLGSCWKSGGCLIGWWRGHMHVPPEKHQDPSTFQWGQPLLKSHLGDHPHLQVCNVAC